MTRTVLDSQLGPPTPLLYWVGLGNDIHLVLDEFWVNPEYLLRGPLEDLNVAVIAHEILHDLGLGSPSNIFHNFSFFFQCTSFMVALVEFVARLDNQGIVMGVLDPFKICLGKGNASCLKSILALFIRRWLDRENLVHLSNDVDLLLDPILKIQVSNLNELIKKSLKGSAILGSVPFLLVKGALLPLIVL
ncbi:hypothetical protein Acr_14g0001860 [Actinidia rufa]|uniref:Uncharacterized protein n=1 Tax=Actinidia rufa TaxID=165716 RepID=A0A7J0FPI3_9ERIC|nr:hypothetical protein Acr_14g0001860 [Actinidia rufa]